MSQCVIDPSQFAKGRVMVEIPSRPIRIPGPRGPTTGFYYSALAQLVEQLTVNQLVAGSSPAGGANFSLDPALQTSPTPRSCRVTSNRVRAP